MNPYARRRIETSRINRKLSMRINRPATKAGGASTMSALPATSRAGWQCHDGLRQYRYYCTHPLLSLLIINTAYPYPTPLIDEVCPSLRSTFMNDESFGSPIHTPLYPFACGLLEADASNPAFVDCLNPHSSNAGPCLCPRLPLSDCFIDTCISTCAFGAGVDSGAAVAHPFPTFVPSMVFHLASEASGGCITRSALEGGVGGAADRGDRCGSIAGSPAGPSTDRHKQEPLDALGSRRSTRSCTDDSQVSAAFITRCAPSIRRSCPPVVAERRSA
jgi:hypothetical protein